MNCFKTLSCVAILSNPVNSLISAGLSTSETSHDSSLQAKLVQTVSLESLENHEQEGTFLAESIRKWLDDEWIPQEVHIKMAESAQKSYIKCRQNGDDDVMDILLAISNDLESSWQEYDAESFVNAWDIGK